MNKARLEELKKILNERHQNLEQGSQEDFSAQNSDALNFDTSESDTSNSNASNFNASDLNITNSKALNSNDKNSDDLNLNAERDRKFQNLDSDNATLFKNSNARNYDKEPIVIKKLDDLFWLIALGILLICSLTYHFSSEYKFRFYMKILLGYGTAFFFIYAASFINSKKTITFMKDKIEFKNKTKCEKEIALNNISVYRYAYMIPNFAPFDVKIKFCALVLFIMIFVALYNFKFYMFIFIIMGLLLMPIIKFIYYILFEKTVRFLLCDKLLICNGSDSEVFTINNKKEFGELQKYFLDTLNIDITEEYLFWKPPYDIAKIIVNKMNKFYVKG